jgi:hypothetical protein
MYTILVIKPLRGLELEVYSRLSFLLRQYGRQGLPGFPAKNTRLLSTIKNELSELLQ